MAINALSNPYLSVDEEVELALNISKMFAKRVLLPEMIEQEREKMKEEIKKELMLELKAAEALQKAQSKARKKARRKAQSEARKEAQKVVVVAAEKSQTEKKEEESGDEEVFALCEEHGELTREEVFTEEIKQHKIYRCIYCGHIVRKVRR